MSGPLVIGIDVGTTNLKVLVYSAEGRILGTAVQRCTVDTSAEGWVSQVPEAWWQALDRCFIRLNNQCSLQQVTALAISSQGETLICCDGSGKALAPAISWMDGRAVGEAAWLSRQRNDWYAHHGKILSPFSTLPKILWLQRHRPHFEKQVQRFCQVQDYMVAALTGRWICDINNAAFTNYFKVWDRVWDEAVCAQFGLSDRLPDVAESGYVAGPLQPNWAQRWGLSTDTLVVLGGHDQGCAALGTAPPEEDWTILSTGTAWVLYSPLTAPREDPRGRMIIYCHAMPDRWAWLAACPGGGVINHVLKHFVWRNEGEFESKIESGYDEFFRRENLADDLLVIPYLFGAGLLDDDPTARAAILRLGPHHDAAHLVMGFAEAIAFEVRRNLERLRELGVRTDRLKMLGGAGHSPVWPQLVSDICGVPIDVLVQTDVAPLGAAFLAGRALGLWSDRLPRYPDAEPITPDATAEARCARKFQLYIKAIEIDRDARRGGD